MFVPSKQSCGANPELGLVCQPHSSQPGKQLHQSLGRFMIS